MEILVNVPAQEVDDCVVSLLTQGFTLQQSKQTPGSFAGIAEELILSFEDLPFEVVGAIMQLKVQAIKNGYDLMDFDAIDRATTGQSGVLSIVTACRLVLAASDFALSGEIQPIEISYYVDGTKTHLTLTGHSPTQIIEAAEAA